MKKLICKIDGHSLQALKSSLHLNQEYECRRCKQRFTEDGYGQIVRLTPYWETNNKLFEQLLVS